MFIFALLQLGAASLNAGSQGNIAIGDNPLKIKSIPAGEHDGDCATIIISARGRGINTLRHQFCRSAEIYDIKEGVVVVNENVSNSELFLYYIYKNRLFKKGYNVRFTKTKKVLSTSFIYRGRAREALKFDLVVRSMNPRIVSSGELYYKCIEITRHKIVEEAGKCHT